MCEGIEIFLAAFMSLLIVVFICFIIGACIISCKSDTKIPPRPVFTSTPTNLVGAGIFV